MAYDPALHPPGDGLYRNGYATIAANGIAKNLVTVGAVNDAVGSGVRDLSLKLIAPDGSEYFPYVMPFEFDGNADGVADGIAWLLGADGP